MCAFTVVVPSFFFLFSFHVDVDKVQCHLVGGGGEYGTI